MTVAELIERLEELDPDLPVFVADEQGDESNAEAVCLDRYGLPSDMESCVRIRQTPMHDSLSDEELFERITGRHLERQQSARFVA